MSECQRCGKCCRHPDSANLQALPEDIERWENEGRLDILQYVDPFDIETSNNESSCDIWYNPENREDFIVCPFLTDDGHGIYTCEIYDTRPFNCQFYDCQDKNWRDKYKEAIKN